MAAGPRRSLRGPALGLGVALALALAALWAAPGLARLVVRTGRGGSAKQGEGDLAEVDAFVARALAEAGLTRRLDHAEIDGAVRETWQLPAGLHAGVAAERLKQAARAAGVELHTVARDELDAQVRIYAGAQLRQELLLIPALPADTPPPTPPNRRERPLVALVVAGLGGQDATPLVTSPVPLTVAVRPWTPFALPTARDAARAWQEVLVDLEGRQLDPVQARAAIPFASGVLLREGDLDRLADHGLEGVVVTTSRPSSRALEGLLVLGAWRARERALEDLLARVSHLAAATGATTVVIEHDAPALAGLLRWAEQVAPARYRMVLADEIVRPADVIGILDRDNPRAGPR